MPGTRLPKQSGPLAVQALTALALAALLGLGGCSPRRPIPSDQPRARSAEPAPAAAALEPATVVAEPAAVVVETTPAPVQAEPASAPLLPAGPAPVQAIQEKDVADAPAAQTAAAVQAARQYYVQIGAFGTEANAQGALTWLKGKGYEAARTVRVDQGQTVLFRVQAGPFQDLAAVHKALDALKADWPQAFIPGD
ncbi:MAG: SPOR domain-containing protein [Humidesulfovibrio sp.]|nr:SPOR domain-containing protein [Humidesulfovibrio sp.]